MLENGLGGWCLIQGVWGGFGQGGGSQRRQSQHFIQRGMWFYHIILSLSEGSFHISILYKQQVHMQGVLVICLRAPR